MQDELKKQIFVLLANQIGLREALAVDAAIEIAKENFIVDNSANIYEKRYGINTRYLLTDH